jgi:hypothetical protein
MHANRRPRASTALLALALGLALLGPGAGGRAADGADASTSLMASPAPGPEQGLLRDLSGQSLVASGSKRDGRARTGLALLGLLANAVAAAWTVVTGRPAAAGGGGAGAAAGARAPPSLQPAPI